MNEERRQRLLWRVFFMGPAGEELNPHYQRWDIVGQEGQIIAVCSVREIAEHITDLHNRAVAQ